LEPWNIKQVAQELEESFGACHTETERQCWRAVVKKDVARILDGRKPTPGEASILEKYRIRLD